MEDPADLESRMERVGRSRYRRFGRYRNRQLPQRSLDGLGVLLQLFGFRQVVAFPTRVRPQAVDADEPQLPRGLDAVLHSQQVSHGKVAACARSGLLRAETSNHPQF